MNVIAPVSNPFSTRFVRPGAIPYRFVGNRFGNQHPSASLLADLKSSRVGLIVGPHGSGKSTLLATLAPWFQSAYPVVAPVQLSAPPSSRWFLRAQQLRVRHLHAMSRLVSKSQRELGDGGLLVIDGAEQLSRFAWARVRAIACHRRQTVLATSHRDLAGGTVLHRTASTPAMIRWLTESLVQSCPTSTTSLISQELSRRDLSKLTNVRELWFELYDVVQPSLRA